jgi:hypothetical protein
MGLVQTWGELQSQRYELGIASWAYDETLSRMGTFLFIQSSLH